MPPKLYTVADALAPMPPIQWVCEGLFSVASTSVVFGAPGSKKTWSLLDLAVCIALGQPWLSHTTTQGAVLIVDEESGPKRLLRRLGDVVRGHQADASLPIFATSLHGFNFFAPSLGTGAKDLQDTILQTQARFVIMDALADIMIGGDENAVKDTQKVFHALRQVSEATGAALVLIHHANKVNGYRGSTAISGAIDLLLQVESKSSEPLVKFETVKCRDTEPSKFFGQCVWNATDFFMTEATTAANTNGARVYTKAEKHVLDLMGQTNDRATVKEIEERATVCAPRTAKDALYRLAKDGILKLIAGGNGMAATYEINMLAIVDNPVY